VRRLLCHAGLPAEAVRAVLAARGDNPALAATTAEQLAAELAAEDASQLPAVLKALSRPLRLIRSQEIPADAEVDVALFASVEERKLLDALEAAVFQIRPGMAVGEWLEVAATMIEPIDTFFDKVLVMAEDRAVRANRLALVQKVSTLPMTVLDMSQLPGF
jgi:glycyl-tRNA synthetase beta subunit